MSRAAALSFGAGRWPYRKPLLLLPTLDQGGLTHA